MHISLRNCPVAILIAASVVGASLGGCGGDSKRAPSGQTDATSADTAVADAADNDAIATDTGGSADVNSAGSDAAASVDAAAADAGSGCAGGCDDKNTCTNDQCLGGKCVNVPNTESCDDGLPCTTGDTCALGKCEGQSTWWEKTFGGADEDIGRAAIGLVDGGLVIAGSTKSSGAGKRDAWLLRIDAVGKVLWQKTYGTDTDQSAHAVRRADNYVVVGGTWRGAGDKRNKGWVQKVDLDGKPLASHLFKLDEMTEVHGVALAGAAKKPSLRLHVAGYREDTKGDIAMAVAMLDNDTLQPLWTKTYGTTGFDAAWDVGQHYNGDLVVVGDTAPGGGGPHVWLLGLDATGKTLWERTYHGNGEDTGWAVTSHPDPVGQNKGYTVAGSRKAPGKKVTAAWVMHADKTGISKWQVTHESPGGASAYDVALFDGGFAAVGRSAKKLLDDRATAWRLDNAGKIKWSVTAGGTGASGRAVVVWNSEVAMVGQTATGKKSDLLVVRMSKAGKTVCP